jgi:hypothetical protein
VDGRLLRTVGWLVLLSAAYPLARAWWANRQTTLLQAVSWAAAAWALWLWALFPATVGAASVLAPYLALSVTGCAGVAVLGAQRPRVGAWNFVVLGLLAVMLLPLVESLVMGSDLLLTAPRAVFLVGMLAVCILINYLPTRLAPAALLLGAGCAVQVAALSDPAVFRDRADAAAVAGCLLVGLAPWAAYERIVRRPRPVAEFDRLWLDFRDRFGLFWAQRLRDQFNRAAAHAGWPAYLRWRGLRLQPGARLPAPAVQAAMLDALRGLMKRFGPAGIAGPPPPG